MPYGALTFFAGRGYAGTALPGPWRYSYAPDGAGEACAVKEFDDSAWEEAAVPGQHAATAERGAIWYRVRFPRPAGGGQPRRLVRFGGAFQSTAVWLNGRLLGQHYGYFSPFAFDITDDLADKNVLAVCCESKVEPVTAAKRHPMGVFNDWDCRPYPNGVRGQLPPEYVWSQPLGLWAPVDLVEAGDVIMQQVKYTPRPGGVQVVASLANLSPTAVEAVFAANLSGGAGGTETGGTVKVTLAPHGTAAATLELDLESPRLWWPWTHGEPYLYTARAAVEARGRVSMTDTRRVGLRTVEYRGETSPEGPAWYINGRPMFPRGTNYISDFRLDTCSYDRHRTDVQLMRDANMDMVRVHVHVEPESFYDACDELGVLVVSDSVLNACYCYGAPPEDRVFQDWAARDQVEKTVGLLYNHPSVAAWLIHNEPPWPEHMWWFGEPHKTRAAREVDLSCTLRVRELDQYRPVITASGEKDTHTYGGWYHDTWLWYRQLAPRFVTEYGAQALPSPDSPVWEHLRRDWPVNSTEPTWLWADYQPEMWAQYGIGPPEDFGSLQAYIEASQRYQAWIARYGAERFRLLKGRPCGGILHFMFVDGHPAITWAVLDYDRRPKEAYFALRNAFRPTHVCIDPTGDLRTDRTGRVLFPAGTEIGFDLWLVNDDPGARGPAELLWQLEGTELKGEITVEIPDYAEPARLVLPVRWSGPAGEVTLRTVLHQDGRVLDRNSLAAILI